MSIAILMRESALPLMLPADVRLEIERRFGRCVVIHSPADLERPDIAAELAAVRFILSGWGALALDDACLRRFPSLEAVFHTGGTVRSLVTPEFWRRGVRISTAAEVNAIPVAEFTFAAIVFATKRIWPILAAARDAGRPADAAPCGLYGADVGLVSLSRVGRRVAGLLVSAGAVVRAFDPFVPDGELARMGVRRASLEETFETSEVVSLHTPLLESTRGMITGRHLRAMRPHATFINTARGAVVREDEMIAALRDRPDLVAVLDVTEAEPLPAVHPLRSLSNVFLTPHVAGSLDRECRRLGRFAVAELDRYLEGEPLLGEVTEVDLARVA